MTPSRLTGQRLTAIFLLGWVLFDYPLLFVFNRKIYLFGIPMLYAYVFLAWAVLIALMAWVVERQKD